MKVGGSFVERGWFSFLVVFLESKKEGFDVFKIRVERVLDKIWFSILLFE